MENLKHDIQETGDLKVTDAQNLRPHIDNLRDLRNLIDQIDEGIKDLEEAIAIE